MKISKVNGNSPATKRERGPAVPDLLGPPALVLGEDPAEFEALRQRVFDTLKPDDAIEEILARDVVEHTWDIKRFRTYKASVMRLAAHAALRSILAPLCGHQEASRLAEGWAKGDAESKEAVAKLLAAASLGLDAVMAEAFGLRREQIELIERLIAAFEMRRANASRELARHRETFAVRLGEEITDAEYEEITPGAGTNA